MTQSLCVMQQEIIRKHAISVCTKKKIDQHMRAIDLYQNRSAHVSKLTTFWVSYQHMLVGLPAFGCKLTQILVNLLAYAGRFWCKWPAFIYGCVLHEQRNKGNPYSALPSSYSLSVTEWACSKMCQTPGSVIFICNIQTNLFELQTYISFTICSLTI